MRRADLRDVPGHSKSRRLRGTDPALL